MAVRIIAFNATSIDGFTEGFAADAGAFYALLAKRPHDVSLAGSDTILAAPAAEPDRGAYDSPEPGAGAGPVLAVIDSQGRIKTWDWLRRQSHWREVVVIGCAATPVAVRRTWEARKLRAFFTQGSRVDLKDAIAQLVTAYGAKAIHVESGGTLNGLLLDAGLIDEIEVLIHPVVVGGRNRRTLFAGAERSAAPNRARKLALVSSAPQENGLIYLRYRVERI